MLKSNWFKGVHYFLITAQVVQVVILLIQQVNIYALIHIGYCFCNNSSYAGPCAVDILNNLRVIIKRARGGC